MAAEQEPWCSIKVSAAELIEHANKTADGSGEEYVLLYAGSYRCRESLQKEKWEKLGPGRDSEGKYNPALPPRGISFGKPPIGLRNHDCKLDSHRDPDNSGLCIHCAVRLAEDENDG